MSTQKLTQLSLLTAIALIIFSVELQIPQLLPIPGAKLGLANIITVYAVYHYRGREVLLILLARIILGSIFSGNLMAIAYSMAGGMMCFGGMMLLKGIVPQNYLWMSSVGGAILHNIGQLTAAVMLTKTIAIIAYFPLLFITGSIAGAFTGMCAQFIMQRLAVSKVSADYK